MTFPNRCVAEVANNHHAIELQELLRHAALAGEARFALTAPSLEIARISAILDKAINGVA